MSIATLWRRALMVAAAAVTIGAAAPAAARPITLDEAVRTAEEQSPLVAAAEAALAAAEARARQAGVGPNPELEVELENALGTGPYSGVGGAEVTVAVEQRFERGGRRSARVRLARAEVDVASLNLLRVRADLVRDVRIAFAELVAAQERRALAREAVERATELARVAGLLVETGRDPPLRQMRAEAARAEARAAEEAALQEVGRTRSALAALIGSDDDDLEPSGSVIEPALQAQPAVPLAVRVAEAERRVAEARIDVAGTQNAPDITARAGVRGFAETRDVALVGGISVPLPIRDRNRGGIEAATAELRGAEARVAQARLDTNREARDARTLLAAADARLLALEGAGLAQAREAVRVARIGYSAGRFSLVEVLDAEAALNAALAGLVEARRDRARALAALQRAQAE